MTEDRTSRDTIYSFHAPVKGSGSVNLKYAPSQFSSNLFKILLSLTHSKIKPRVQYSESYDYSISEITNI